MVASKGNAKHGGLRGKSKTHGKRGGAKEHVPHAPAHSGHDAKVRKGAKKMGGKKHGGRMGRRGS